jgi:hypothetical protein
MDVIQKKLTALDIIFWYGGTAVSVSVALGTGAKAKKEEEKNVKHSFTANTAVVTRGWCTCARVHVCVRCGRLRENYKMGKSGSTSKNTVYQHYLDMCQEKGIEPSISATYFGCGKLI